MLSHVFVGVSDFERSLRFYSAVMGCMGHTLRFSEPERPWAGWHSEGGRRPFFVIALPHDREAHHSGNGQMTAFMAPSRAVVDAAHAEALAHGGRCEGPPGLRLQYHANYYGAYFRDPDGNKLAVACHEAE
ncbi:MAG: VOC family protein [Hydrogenophaga sp.]